LDIREEIKKIEENKEKENENKVKLDGEKFIRFLEKIEKKTANYIKNDIAFANQKIKENKQFNNNEINQNEANKFIFDNLTNKQKNKINIAKKDENLIKNIKKIKIVRNFYLNDPKNKIRESEPYSYRNNIRESYITYLSNKNKTKINTNNNTNINFIEKRKEDIKRPKSLEFDEEMYFTKCKLFLIKNQIKLNK